MPSRDPSSRARRAPYPRPRRALAARPLPPRARRRPLAALRRVRGGGGAAGAPSREHDRRARHLLHRRVCAVRREPAGGGGGGGGPAAGQPAALSCEPRLRAERRRRAAPLVLTGTRPARRSRPPWRATAWGASRARGAASCSGSASATRPSARPRCITTRAAARASWRAAPRRATRGRRRASLPLQGPSDGDSSEARIRGFRPRKVHCAVFAGGHVMCLKCLSLFLSCRVTFGIALVLWISGLSYVLTSVMHTVRIPAPSRSAQRAAAGVLLLVAGAQPARARIVPGQRTR
jgi:hypothetical protein